MAWIGYWVYDGTEIINASRTEAYAHHAGLSFFKAVYRNTALPLILGDDYTSPLQDDAPWTDPDHLESYDFYGAYPLDLTGAEDSTVAATVVESTADGGYVQSPRRATRAMVFSLALVGGSECALDYGMNWLRTVLNGGGCITRPCKGANLDFLSCEPALDMTYAASTATVELVTIDGGTPAGAGPEPVDGGTAAVPGSTIVDGGDPSTNPVSGIVVAPTVDLTTCLPEYQRSFHGVTFTAGPAVTAKMVTSSGQSVWTVEVTAVAADPAAYGAEHPLIAGFCAQNVDDPYVGGVPSGGIWDDDGYVTTDPACPTVVYAPVFDPTCPLLIPPPQVPDIPIGCNDFPDNFRRRMFTVPDKSVPTFGSVVPILTIHCPGSDVNNLRVRFYPDADNDQDPDDLCVYQGSALFTYLPANSTITFDAVDKAVYVDTPGMPTRRGDSIVIGDDGGPLEWPELVCGHGWVVTVDLPQTASLPSFDMSLYAKVT